jgi:ABC-type transporter Mla maintaining outer membrane lipid asymmetry ATPase subunit MlaF
MGPSGSGKTTTLSMLTGKVLKSRGVIKINGVEHSKGLHEYLSPLYRQILPLLFTEDPLDMFLNKTSFMNGKQCIKSWNSMRKLVYLQIGIALKGRDWWRR